MWETRSEQQANLRGHPHLRSNVFWATFWASTMAPPQVQGARTLGWLRVRRTFGIGGASRGRPGFTSARPAPRAAGSATLASRSPPTYRGGARQCWPVIPGPIAERVPARTREETQRVHRARSGARPARTKRILRSELLDVSTSSTSTSLRSLTELATHSATSVAPGLLRGDDRNLTTLRFQPTLPPCPRGRLARPGLHLGSPGAARGRLRYARLSLSPNIPWWCEAVLAGDPRPHSRAGTCTDTRGNAACASGPLGGASR